MRDFKCENELRITVYSSWLLALLLLLGTFLALSLFLLSLGSNLVLRLRPLLLRFYSWSRCAPLVRLGRFLGPTPRMGIFSRLGIRGWRPSITRAGFVISFVICRWVVFYRLWSLRLFLSGASPLLSGRVAGLRFWSRILRRWVPLASALSGAWSVVAIGLLRWNWKVHTCLG
jgi:hypothetical protein